MIRSGKEILNLAKRRILKKCIQFLNHYRGCKKVTVFLGACVFWSTLNNCGKLITELEIFEWENWVLEVSLTTCINWDSVWRRLHIRMNLLMLTWEATYIAFVIAPRNTRKEKGDIFKMKNKMTQPHKATYKLK